MRPSYGALTALSTWLALAILVGHSAAQNMGAAPAHGETAPPPPPTVIAPPAPAGRPAYVPIRATDTAAVARGRDLFVNQYACASCHAADLRGADNGNSLLRSIAVMQDAKGELIGRATRASRTHAGRFDSLTEAQLYDISQFTKSFRNIGTGAVEILKPVFPTAGDPVAGQRYFASNCASCHAVNAGQASSAVNLAGAGAGVETYGLLTRNLQQRWLNPTTTKPTMATVTLPNGQTLEGRAVSFDELRLVMTMPDGAVRTFERDGDNPRIKMTYPLAFHAELPPKLTDKQIHDVTGYLVSLK
jgi:cytochrome c oxidase cbb3-type subunit 3